MDISTRFQYSKKIKLALIFFCCISLYQCNQNKDNQSVKVIYTDTNATAVWIPTSASKDAIQIMLKGHKTPILGDFNKIKDGYEFKPLVPFTRGETYTVAVSGKSHEFTISHDIMAAKPELLYIYPGTDTVPENLLKMYFVFSKPMQEVGNALGYIKVKNLNTNSDEHPFLALQTELWNKDHTQLTVWLDPGRIKKDLIPNKKLGAPLQKGHQYEITVVKNWKDARGEPLTKARTKKIYVTHKDTLQPNINTWNLKVPVKQTKTPLVVSFNEPLDAVLVHETISIEDPTGMVLKGELNTGNNETSVQFIPDLNWKSGMYLLKVGAHLEDLAANNLNRLFDQDLKTADSTKLEKAYYTRSFKID